SWGIAGAVFRQSRLHPYVLFSGHLNFVGVTPQVENRLLAVINPQWQGLGDETAPAVSHRAIEDQHDGSRIAIGRQRYERRRPIVLGTLTHPHVVSALQPPRFHASP